VNETKGTGRELRGKGGCEKNVGWGGGEGSEVD
jgi:hypothetical protein